MILAHEQEQELNQEEEAVPSTRGEDFVPSHLLWNGVVLLDYALAMVDQLINQSLPPMPGASPKHSPPTLSRTMRQQYE